MTPLRYILVDDERLARAEMKRMLYAFPNFSLVGEAGNAVEAEKLIAALEPDLIFLDVQLPGLSGLELLTALQPRPAVIFVTAFDQYAVAAFELNALDYLLKPVREERLTLALEKVVGQPQHTRAYPPILIKEREKIYLVKPTDIYLIESIGNYARIYFEQQKVFFKRSLNQLEKVLDPDLFFRINRSQLINVSFIEIVKQLPDGRLQFTLKNAEVFTASNRQSAQFRAKSSL